MTWSDHKLFISTLMLFCGTIPKNATLTGGMETFLRENSYGVFANIAGEPPLNEKVLGDFNTWFHLSVTMDDLETHSEGNIWRYARPIRSQLRNPGKAAKMAERRRFLQNIMEGNVPIVEVFQSMGISHANYKTPALKKATYWRRALQDLPVEVRRMFRASIVQPTGDDSIVVLVVVPSTKGWRRQDTVRLAYKTLAERGIVLER